MDVDSTSLGIVLGILGSVIFGIMEFRKKHEFDISNVALIFLAIFAIIAGVELIIAALHGDPTNLPSAWREYLAVAGMVGIGLSLNFVIQAGKRVLSEVDSGEEEQQSESAER